MSAATAARLNSMIREQVAEIRGQIAELEALGARDEARSLRMELVSTMVEGLR